VILARCLTRLFFGLPSPWHWWNRIELATHDGNSGPQSRSLSWRFDPLLTLPAEGPQIEIFPFLAVAMKISIPISVVDLVMLLWCVFKRSNLNGWIDTHTKTSPIRGAAMHRNFNPTCNRRSSLPQVRVQTPWPTLSVWEGVWLIVLCTSCRPLPPTLWDRRRSGSGCLFWFWSHNTS
jgi:hypothetical protein